MTHTLILATTNHGKLEELRSLLQDSRVRLLTVDQVLKNLPNVVEDGRTFAENAAIKARAYAAATMMLTLADDSGLEVDALEGRPGVRSARFAHERATDAENNAALLSALEGQVDPIVGVAPGSYPARFRCALSIVDPYDNSGEPLLVEGVCEGSITRSPRGGGGFGYDPLFLVAGMDKTLAELTAEEKGLVSHRARACSALRPVLHRLLEARDKEADRIARP